jgi:YesN/AraC family two-component response regulator
LKQKISVGFARRKYARNFWLEAIPMLKNLDSSIKIVMVTKNEEEHIMEQAIGSEISDYILKPVNPNQVLLSLKKIFKKMIW